MTDLLSAKKLSKNFYRRDVLIVAKDLLGKIFVKKDKNGILAGKIVEVEAYHGDFDQAAHTYRRKTKRNEIMFEAGGCLYVYFTYGSHFCCNIVTGKKGHGTAVLIRALEPLTGVDKMIKNRFGRNLKNENEIFNLTNGPGKVCAAFGINKSHLGTELTGGKIFLLGNKKIAADKVGISKRIGITRSVNLPWRFFIKNNPFLSRK